MSAAAQPDWFAANAPKTPTTAPASGGDWFADNSPTQAASPSFYDKAKNLAETFVRTIPGIGSAHELASVINDWASQKMSPSNPQMLSPAETFGTGVVRDASGLVKSATSPTGIATTAATVAAPEIMGPALVGHGLYRAYQDRGNLGNPDVLQNELNDAAEVAGGAATTGAAARAGGGLPTKATQQAIQKVGTATGLIDPAPEVLMTKAVKPMKNNLGWDNAIQSAMPNIKGAEADLGHPIQGVEDAIDATQLAKKKIWQQYVAKLGPAAQQGAVIDGNEIADAMMDSIDKRTATQNPALVDKISKVADTYRRPIPINDAEDFLQSANQDLLSYYAKNKVGQRVALNDPEKAYTVAEADALRDALYSKLNEISGPGAADLKQQYGALSNVESELWNRKQVSARQQPQSLSEQLSTARGYGRMAKGVLTLDLGDIAEGAENIATSKWLKDRNSTDAMITRAFAKTPLQPSQVFPGARTSAGALPSGPIFTPAPADASGPIQGPTPTISPDTRAVRLGLLLPEASRGPIVTPPTTAESLAQLLDAKSVVQRDPRTGRMRRIYVSEGK